MPMKSVTRVVLSYLSICFILTAMAVASVFPSILAAMILAITTVTGTVVSSIRRNVILPKSPIGQ